MIEPQGTVHIDLSSLVKFREQVESGLKSGSGAFKDMYLQWAARYRAFVQERFDRLSRGSGEWPPLKIKSRKHKRGDIKRASILRDTNTLFAALNPTFSGNPGALQELIPYGIEVGYGGPHLHPSGKGVSVADIAEFHDKGMWPNPKRQIIVPPDAHILKLMASDAERAIQSELNRVN